MPVAVVDNGAVGGGGVTGLATHRAVNIEVAVEDIVAGTGLFNTRDRRGLPDRTGARHGRLRGANVERDRTRLAENSLTLAGKIDPTTRPLE